MITTETAGLPEVARPSVIPLRYGDHLDLDISPMGIELDGGGARPSAWPHHLLCCSQIAFGCAEITTWVQPPVSTGSLEKPCRSEPLPSVGLASR